MPKATKDTKSKKIKTETKVTNKKKTSTSKKSTATTKKKEVTAKKSPSKVKKLESNVVAEYYDLPYRYNETIVKILYQTPTILFVYWDISDEDRKNFSDSYGEDFFTTTYPVLKVYNITKHSSFEVPINDFANSWYIHVEDAGCDYKVELFRKSKEDNQKEIYISSSNDMELPNDHILLESLPSTISFKNVKTNEKMYKEISTLRLVGIQNIHSVQNFYQTLYKEDILEEIHGKKLINPSSSSW